MSASHEPVQYLHYDPATMERALVALQHACVPPKFHLSRATIHVHTTGDPNFEPECARVARVGDDLVGFCMGKRWVTPFVEFGEAANPIAEEVRNVQAGIAAILVAPWARRQGIGTRLLRDVEAALRERNVEAITAGREPGLHLTPGVPDELSAGHAFFEALGYAPAGRAVDVMGSIADFMLSPALEARAESLRAEGYHVRSYTPGDHDALLAFLQDQFSGRWHKKALYYVERRRSPDPYPVDDLVLAVRRPPGKSQDASDAASRAGEGEEVVGFAMTWTPASQSQGSPCRVFANDDPTYGGLGPIGLHRAVRNKGLGLLLLGKSLLHLQIKGIRRVLIDWTSEGLATGYYAKFGFAPYIWYQSYVKEFD